MKIDYPAYVRLFLLILISTVFVFGGTQLGMLAYRSVFATEEIFPAGTSIGPVSVAGSSSKEATQKLEDAVSQWKKSSSLSLTYGDQKVTIPPDAITFLLAESVAGAQKGAANPLHVSLSAGEVHSLLLQLTSKKISSFVNTKDLVKEVEKQAGSLQMEEQTISLTAFFNPEGPVMEQVLANADMGVQDTHDLTEPVTFDVAPYATFSFLKDAAAKYPSWPDAKLTAAASALYKASLQTNLQIRERQVSTELPPGIQAGFEAKVKRKEIDFILSNPNDFRLQFTFQAKGTDRLHVTITGYPLSKCYKFRTVNQKNYPFRKIVQYSSLVPSSSEIVKQNGSNGSSVTVYRDIYSANGGLIKSEKISDDFYLPVNQIVLRPIASPTDTSIGTTNSTATNSAAGAVTGTTDNSTNQNSNAGTTGGAAGNTTNQNFATNNGTKNNNQTNTSTTDTGANNGTN